MVGRGDKVGRSLLIFLVVATAITGVLGASIFLLVSDTVKSPAFGLPMIVLGAILLADAAVIRFARSRRLPSRRIQDLTLKDDILIGIVQGLSAFPGVSRSGVTVSAMLLLGVNPEDSFRLSFLALIPASVGASLVSVLFSGSGLSSVISTVTVPVMAIAIVTAALVSLVLIKVLLGVAASRRITILVLALGLIAIFSGVTSLLTGYG